MNVGQDTVIRKRCNSIRTNYNVISTFSQLKFFVCLALLIDKIELPGAVIPKQLFSGYPIQRVLPMFVTFDKCVLIMRLISAIKFSRSLPGSKAFSEKYVDALKGLYARAMNQTKPAT